MWPLTRKEWRDLFVTWRWIAVLGTPAIVLLFAVAEWRHDGLALDELVAVAALAPFLTVVMAPMLWLRWEARRMRPGRALLLIALAIAWAVGVYGLIVIVAMAAGWIGPIWGGPGSVFGPGPGG